jgi:hypothetical protein
VPQLQIGLHHRSRHVLRRLHLNLTNLSLPRMLHSNRHVVQLQQPRQRQHLQVASARAAAMMQIHSPKHNQGAARLLQLRTVRNPVLALRMTDNLMSPNQVRPRTRLPMSNSLPHHLTLMLAPTQRQVLPRRPGNRTPPQTRCPGMPNNLHHHNGPGHLLEAGSIA